MKIAIDGGGYCTVLHRRFGNYTVTDNLIQSLLKYDTKNFYSIYSFCNRPTGLSLPSNWNYNLLLPRRLWMKFRVSLEEFISKKDIFLALNQAVPIYSKAKIITFSHGLSYYYFPHFYRESYIRLTMQLQPMIDKSDYIIVSSQKVKDEMREAYPSYKHVYVIPFGVPLDMMKTLPKTSQSPYGKYFLFVGMNHPIKNIRFLVKAFRTLRKYKEYRDYKLLLVGPEYMKSIPHDNIVVIASANRQELRNLYRQAVAYISASLYESFNLPILEALSQECQVVALDSAVISELSPYVLTVKTFKEFVSMMEEVAQGRKKTISLSKLKKEFSWQTYVHKLMELY